MMICIFIDIKCYYLKDVLEYIESISAYKKHFLRAVQFVKPEDY